MFSELLNVINEKYPLTEKGAGDFSTMKVNGMKFDIKSFEAEGLGHVSTMRGKGFLGLMKMDTLIINPTEADLPIISYDRIKAMHNDKLYVEFYDTMTEETNLDKIDNVGLKYAGLTTVKPKANWYDSIKLPQTVTYAGKKKDSDTFDKAAIDYITASVNIEAPKVTNYELKKEKSDYYVDGLLNNGGPATDVFLKAIGKEKTTKLFKEVLF